MDYSWPGNIRQFENAIEHAVAMSGTASELTVDMLPTELREPGQLGMRSEITIPDEGINFASVVSQLERELILRCLEKTGGNKRQAARLLQAQPNHAHRQVAASRRDHRGRLDRSFGHLSRIDLSQ